jgi:hypothetical protein
MSENPENGQKNPNPEKPVAHGGAGTPLNRRRGPEGLYGKLRGAGVLDQVMGALKRGDTLKQVAELCGKLGHPAEMGQIYRLNQRCRIEWQEAEFRERALDAHIEGAGDADTTIEVLIDRIMVAKFAGMIEDAEGPDALERVMPLWTAWKRMRTAERAEARAERAEERAAKEVSKAVAVKFLDMLNSEDMAAKLRAVRDDAIVSGGGIEKQVEAIQNFLWGDLFEKAA